MLDLFHSKCAYCEQPIGGASGVEVDRFRPAAGATNLSGEGSLDHYAWLSLEWRNLYPSCTACNRAKRSFFPIDGPRAPLLAPIETIREIEKAQLVDPCFDLPEEHLSFNEAGTVSALTFRGEVTIKVLNLNRPPLVSARANVWQATIARLGRGEAPERIAAQLPSSGQRHIAVVRAALADWKGVPGQTFVKAVPREERSAEAILADEEAFRLTARPLQSVEIQNFKLLRDLKLRFPEPQGEHAPWLMLLGENASGKSTILQAIGLALAGTIEAERYMTPSRALTTGTEEGFVKIRFWDQEHPAELHFRRHAEQFDGTHGPSCIVLGYGALRVPGARRPRADSPVPRFSKIDPLLRPVARIPHPGRWLAELEPKRFDVAARALKDILPLDDKMVMVRSGGRILFEVGAHRSTLGDLSAGYQTIVGVSVDIMRLLFERWQTLSSATAIVLIDELDAHLHPRWKMRIVRSLREAFPLVQFVASTHDPLVLRGIKNGEVAVLRRDEQHGAVADQDLPAVEGMQVDELLTSRHFGLESTLDPLVEASLNELYHLESLPPQPDRLARIADLRARIGDKEALGRNQREQLMLEAANEYLRLTANDPARRTALKAETINRLQGIVDRSARAPQEPAT